MRAPEALAEYVREALAQGGDRPAIAEAARAAGWTATEVEAALDAWVDAPGLPPVPRPRATVSARDAFRHGLMFFALLLVAGHLGALAFALIDRLLPDPLESWPAGDGTIRWAVAVLVVAWPVWALMSLSLAREAERDPGQRRSAVGRWLTWGALFLAAATLIGDAVAIVSGFLAGGFGLRFLLKALAVATIAGAVFFAYGRTREADGGATLPQTRGLVAGFGLVVLVAIGAGLMSVGGPDSGRRERRDMVRLDALSQVADGLACHVRAGAEPARPATVGEISPACLGPDAAARLVDPLTGEAYRINYPAPDRAAICAAMEAPVAATRALAWRGFDAASGCMGVSFDQR